MITEQVAAPIAARLGCEVAAVLAVAEVESNGSGFLPDGRPQILFEAQWFHKFTGGQFDASHPRLSSPTWNRALYVGGTGEWDRLNEAMTLDAEAALKSASWGAMQVMGFNFAACGFATVTAFVDAMKRGEEGQLEAFAGFIAANGGMHSALIIKDWQTFARLYNGPGAVAAYSSKIASAYARHAAQPVTVPIPAADPNPVVPAGYTVQPSGNVVREDVKDSSIVQGANHGAVVATISTVGAAGAAVAPLMSADWKVILALGGVAVAGGIVAIVYLLLIKGRRVEMSKQGIA